MAAREGAIMPVGHIRRVAADAGDSGRRCGRNAWPGSGDGPGGHGCAGGRSGNEVIQRRPRLLTRARHAGASGLFRSGIASEPGSRR